MVRRKPCLCRRLHAQQADFNVVEKTGEQADGVGTAAHAGQTDIGQSAEFLKHLGAGLAPDNRLKMTHHIRIRMRPHGRAQYVKHVGIADPHAQGFVHRFLESALARGGGQHARAEHLHANHVQMLALNVHLAHADCALEAHERRARGRGHAVLARTGFGNNPLFAHPLGQQALTQGIVDLGARPGGSNPLA